jgi:hypothetical protein
MNNDDWIAIIALALFALFWFFVCTMLSRSGGWASIAKKYPKRNHAEDLCTAVETSKRFRFASLSLGKGLFSVNYGGCLRIVVAPHGIGIGIQFMFRPGHPPLFIPWSAVDSCEEIKQFYFLQRVALYAKGVTDPLLFSGRAGREIFAKWSAKTSASDRHSALLSHAAN